MAKKKPLTPERVITAAVTLADKQGVEALSMRKLGQKLGVEAMSLYNHVANKDELLDGMVDAVIAEIKLPSGKNWKRAMRKRAQSAREVLHRHPWAIRLLESRKNPGPATFRYFDSIIGCLREGGFSIAMAAHAFSVIDSYLYGFVLQEVKMPFDTPEELQDLATDIMQQMPIDEYPHFAELTIKHVLKPGYSYAKEFEFGLDLILNGLETASKAKR